ncbi:hypothetical protein PAHAL_5G074700 [Panicum hallii]|uniref:Uncharacterized protein n=1 Tax=Panicum hallii TaxID=206008 RepID=A0A2T8IJ98_9POAL|nr:hypothetical protein PAHAL_5G074700 [Panicum hallii]
MDANFNTRNTRSTEQMNHEGIRRWFSSMNDPNEIKSKIRNLLIEEKNSVKHFLSLPP